MAKSIKVHEIITERLIKAIEGDELPWRKPWRMGEMPHNVVTKRPYRGGNVIHLLMASILNDFKYNAWVGRNQVAVLAAQQGRNIYIRNEEYRNSTPILVPVPRQAKDKNGELILENGQPVTLMSFMYKDVYNVAQLENFDASVLDIDPTKNQPIEVMEKVFAERQNPCEIKHSFTNTRAYYAPREDYINMPDRSLFDSSEAYYLVLGHEIVHSTGAAKRLGRIKDDWREEEPYSLEELTAEFGTNFIMAMSGVEISPAAFNNSVAYVQHWKKHLSENPTWLHRAATAAYNAAEYVFNQHKVELDEPEPA